MESTVGRRQGRLVAAVVHSLRRLPASRVATRVHARLFVKTGGRAVRRWFGAPVLVLEVVGRRTGKTRRVPLIYMELPQGYVVVAADAGSDRVPRWWLNLRDAGRAVVQIGRRRHPVVPRLVDGAERARVWAQIVDAYPSVGAYTRYTDRRFPVVLLQPVDGS